MTMQVIKIGGAALNDAEWLRRFAEAGEIAEAILFAASKSCGFHTGSLIVIDGGTTAGRTVVTGPVSTLA